MHAVLKIAIELGYRSIDTAAIYGNEAGVGQGIREANIARKIYYIESLNLWLGYEATIAAYEESLVKLGFLDYLDSILFTGQ